MKNDIKKMLRKLSEDQEIHDIQKLILDNVDKSKVINPEPKMKPLAPRKRRFVFPILMGALATAAFVVTFVIAFNFKDNCTPENNPNPNPDSNVPVEPDAPVIYEDVNLDVAEAFYSSFTTIDASNMINIVNTFNNISYVEVPDTSVSEKKHYLTPELEESIVNDVDAYRFNIEEMFGKVTSTRTQTLNENPLYNYKKVIDVVNDNFEHHIYFTENILEVIDSDESSFRYKSELNGVVVSGSHQYSFTGIKRIKKTRLSYELNIIIDDNNYVEVKEQYDINSDLTINYKTFNYDYIYHSNDSVKNVRIEQKFDSEQKTKEIEFVANEGKSNEAKMTFKPNDTYYLKSSIKSRESEELYITKNTDSYTYKFKNSKNEYVK